MNRLQSNLQSVLFNEKIKNLTAQRTKKLQVLPEAFFKRRQPDLNW